MSTLNSIDFSTIPAPAVVETISFEQILSEMLTDLQARDSVFTALTESDPAYKILEVAAYRETLLRQKANDDARAVMLAYATGTDLDNLAAFYFLTRLVIEPENTTTVPPTPAVMETDEAFRRRIVLSSNGYSTAGPRDAYIFHALSADSDVLDAYATSPAAGEVLVSIISREGDGSPSSELLDAVEAVLTADSIRPLTDNVTVAGATKTNYHVNATLTVYPGPDSAIVLQNAKDALDAYIASVRKIGYDVTLSGLYAALHQVGVQRVNLTHPTANIVIGQTGYAHCTSTSVTIAGVDQ
jgi:phage-related baseplate assembly protein